METGLENYIKMLENKEFNEDYWFSNSENKIMNNSYFEESKTFPEDIKFINSAENSYDTVRFMQWLKSLNKIRALKYTSFCAYFMLFIKDFNKEYKSADEIIDELSKKSENRFGPCLRRDAFPLLVPGSLGLLVRLGLYKYKKIGNEIKFKNENPYTEKLTKYDIPASSPLDKGPSIHRILDSLSCFCSDETVINKSIEDLFKK